MQSSLSITWMNQIHCYNNVIIKIIITRKIFNLWIDWITGTISYICCYIIYPQFISKSKDINSKAISSVIIIIVSIKQNIKLSLYWFHQSHPWTGSFPIIAVEHRKFHFATHKIIPKLWFLYSQWNIKSHYIYHNKINQSHYYITAQFSWS